MRMYHRYQVFNLKRKTWAKIFLFFAAIFIIFRLLLGIWGIGITGFALSSAMLLFTFWEQKFWCDVDGLQCIFQTVYRKKICYGKIQLLVISNSMSSGRYHCKMGETIKINGKKKFVQYAHLTLFNQLEMVKYLDLAPGKQNISLFFPYTERFITKTNPLYESVCWLDYLEELLTHVQTAPIYILEDVYARFQPDYDRIFSKAKNPIYIITAPQTCRQYLRKNVI